MLLSFLLLLAAPAVPHQKVHAGMQCASCHSEPAAHRVSIVTMCGHCHEREAATLAASQHGMARDDGPNCMSCHGAHQIRSAEQIERQCLGCHAAPPMAILHPVKRVAGKVSCMNCHSAHSD